MQLLWFLEGMRSPVLTALFQGLTLLGEQTVILCVIAALYWCVDRRAAYGLCIAFFVSALLVQGLKIIVRVERPWVLDPAFAPVLQAVRTATGYSFPSGHTQAAASLYGYLGMASGKRGARVLGWSLAALVGLSRMYLGVHTPLDVLAALLVSLLVVLAVIAYQRANLPDRPLTIFLGCLSAAIIVLALAFRGTVDAHNLADACKAAGGCLGCAVGLSIARRRILFPNGTDALWQQLVKLLLGVAGLAALQFGLKWLLGDGLGLAILRYFLIALWALALYPWAFSRWRWMVGDRAI